MDPDAAVIAETGTRSQQKRLVLPMFKELNQVFRIATREARVLLRSYWGLGLVLFFAVFSVSVVGFGASGVGPGSYASVVVSLLEFGVYLVPLSALTAGYDAIVRDYEAGTLDMLLALPVSRTQVLAGKYLGRLAVLLGALVLGLGVGGAVAISIVGPAGIDLYSLFVLASMATAAIFLGISILISTLTRQTLRALGYAQITWLWFVLLHDLLALGAIAEFSLPGGALETMVLTNPTDLYRLVLLGQLEAPAGGYAALLSETALSTPLLLSAVTGWVLLPVGLSLLVIHYRR